MAERIQPVEKSNVADIVFQKMLDLIIEGVWGQGEKIPSENELREAFSVSRDTVRQAIHRLNAMGIVQSYQGKGTFVTKLDASIYYNLLVPSLCLNEQDSISVLQFMKCIQVESARIVASKATDEEIAGLQDYLQQMQEAEGYENYFLRDMDYHCYLSKLTGNGLFVKTMEIIARLLHVYLRDIVAFHGNEKSIAQHKECFEALKERDEERAVRIMVEHCDMLLERMERWLENGGAAGASETKK